MLEYYAILNVPSVPKNIVDAVVSEIDEHDKAYNPPLQLTLENGNVEASADYYRGNLDQRCVDWMIEHIPELAGQQCQFGYQRIKAVQDTSGTMFIHTDGSKRGIYVVSYLLDTGSDDTVTTHWWQEHGHDKHRDPHTFVIDNQHVAKLTSVVFPLNTWHMLDASILHNVSGIKTTRTAITVGFNDKQLADLILSKYAKSMP